MWACRTAPRAAALRELLTPGCCRKCDVGTPAGFPGPWGAADKPD